MGDFQRIKDSVKDGFLSVPEKISNFLNGIPKGIDRMINGPKSDYKLAHSFVETKISDQGCYVRIQMIETKSYVYQKLQDDINPFKEDYQKRPKVDYVTVVYDQIFFKSEDCQPKKYDDPKFEDNIIPDYPIDAPPVAVFIEVNRVLSWVDYFREFTCDFADSVKMSFENIEIKTSEEITFDVRIEKNSKDKITLNDPVGDEGNFPYRRVPWLIDYLASDNNQKVHKTIYTNNIAYNGQQNIFQKYKGVRIGAFISDITDYNTGYTIKGYFLIGHPLIVHREMRRIINQLTWRNETPYAEFISEKYFVFFRELNIASNDYYGFQYDLHAEWGERIRIKRTNAISQSIALIQYIPLTKKTVKVIKKPIPPEKNKECDCMSCNDSLARSILSKVNSLLTKVGELEKECTALKKNVGDFPVEVEITDSDPNKEGNQSKKIKLESIANYIKESFNNNNDIAKILGVSRFPAKLPSRLIKPKDNNDQETINDIPEFLGYLIKQIDKAIGKLPQKIKIADGDLSKPGNQSLEVEIHSLADFARETFKILLDTQPESDIHTQMLVRILYELGFIHQGSIQILADVDAVVEHLDFKHKFIVKEYPFAFNPYCNNNSMARGFGQKKDDQALKEPAKLPNISGNEDELEKMLSKFLQQTWIKVRTIENIEKRSLNQDIQSIRRDVNTAALAVAAKADPKVLKELVDNALIKLQTQDVINQVPVKKAMNSGDLRSRVKQPKDKK
jgi:hypothetical protein